MLPLAYGVSWLRKAPRLSRRLPACASAPPPLNNDCAYPPICPAYGFPLAALLCKVSSAPVSAAVRPVLFKPVPSCVKIPFSIGCAASHGAVCDCWVCVDDDCPPIGCAPRGYWHLSKDYERARSQCRRTKRPRRQARIDAGDCATSGAVRLSVC